MALDQVEELAELVGLGLAAAGLKVEALAGPGMAKDVVAAPDPVELEAEGLGQAPGVGEAHVGELALSEPGEQGAGLHEPLGVRSGRRWPRPSTAATSMLWVP